MHFNLSMETKSKLKEYFLLFILITIAILIIFFSYIFLGNDYLLAYCNDHVFQTPQLYSEYANLLTQAIQTKSFPFYSFNTFLGSNFYGSKLYYCTGTIFLPLLVLLRNNIQLYMLIESILCIYIGFFLFYIYLKKMGVKNKKLSAVFALIYAIGGTATINVCYPMFFRFYAFLPLLFIGIEKYLNNNKLSILSISVCILFSQNYYLLFSVSVFLPIYFLFSCYIKDDGNKFNILKYLKLSIRAIIAYLIGFLLSAIITIPGIMFISNNSRLSYNELAGLLTWPFKTWLGLLFYSLVPIAQSTTLTNPFEIVMNTDNTGITYYYSIYNSSLTVLGILSLIFNPKTKVNKSLIVLFLIVFAMIMLLPINSIMFAFTTPSTRVMFLLTFIALLVSAINIDKYGMNNKKIILTFIIIFTIVSLIAIISTDISNKLLVIASISVMLGILYFYTYSKNIKLFYLLIIFEMVITSTLTISLQPYKVNHFSDVKNMLKYQNENDEDKLFRQYIDYKIFPPANASILNQNVNLSYDFMSLYTYDNTFENSLKDFIEITNSDITEHIFNITNPKLWKLLGVKYVGILDDQTLDNINEYEYAFNNNHIQMYKIKDYNHLGHTFSNFISKEDINKNNFNPDEFDWNNTLIVDEELYKIVKDIVPNDKNQLIVNNQLTGNNFNATIKSNSNEVLFISLPYDKAWKFYIDGNLVDTYEVDFGFIGIILEPGDHKLEAWFVPEGFKLGFILSFGGLFLAIVQFIYDNKINNKKLL